MQRRLSQEHIAAVGRRRRVVVNFDVLIIDPAMDEDADALAKERLTYADDPAIRIDSIWWNLGEGNVVPYPSRRRPPFNHPGFRRWIDEGIDIAEILLKETHERGIEGFHSHRMNGWDADPMVVPGVGIVHDGVVKEGAQVGQAVGVHKIPMKEEHPDWLFHTPWSENGLWNFAVEGVHDYVLENLREVAEDHDFDGIELDFARGIVFPEGQGWRNRESLTTFMQKMRSMLLDIEQERGRPFLLAARVPQDPVGCHFDGLDVETWARDSLVDIFVLGCRSFEVDVSAFRSITAGMPIKLYAALDDHHSSDAYCTPPIEVFRGVFSNWYRQGVDGIQTFNWAYAPWNHLGDPMIGKGWSEMHGQAYREMSDPDGTRFLDKTFVVQRRGGGHGDPVVPFPEDWHTPRFSYANSNMQSQLPAPLANDGRTDTLLRLYVGDDVNADADMVETVALRVLLHDPAGGEYLRIPRATPPPPADDARVDRAVVRDWLIPEREGKENPDFLYNSPPAKGIEDRIELRLNNIRLGRPSVERGWLVFAARPNQLALGDNLVGVLATGREDGVQEMTVEKLELDVTYRKP